MFFATGFIGYFYILTFIIGFGAIALLMNDPSFFKDGKIVATGLLGGTNMAAINLAKATGGSLLYGFISAVAFRDHPCGGGGLDALQPLPRLATTSTPRSSRRDALPRKAK